MADSLKHDSNSAHALKDTGLKPITQILLTLLVHRGGWLMNSESDEGRKHNAATYRFIALSLGGGLAVFSAFGALALLIEHESQWHVLGAILLILVCYRLAVNAIIAWRGM